MSSAAGRSPAKLKGRKAQETKMLNTNVVQIILVDSDYPEVCNLLEKRSVLLNQLRSLWNKPSEERPPIRAELDKIETRIVEIFGRTALYTLTKS